MRAYTRIRYVANVESGYTRSHTQPHVLSPSNVVAIYEHCRMHHRTSTSVREGRVPAHTRAKHVHEYTSSVSSFLLIRYTYTHTQTWTSYGEEATEGKSFGQRSLDNRAPSYRRISPHRSKGISKKERHERRRRRRWWWEGEGESSLCCNRSLPIHVEIIARCGSHRDSKLSGNACRAVLGGVFFLLSILQWRKRTEGKEGRLPAGCFFGDLGVKRPPGRLSEDLFVIRWRRFREDASRRSDANRNRTRLKETLRPLKRKFGTA